MGTTTYIPIYGPIQSITPMCVESELFEMFAEITLRRITVNFLHHSEVLLREINTSSTVVVGVLHMQASLIYGPIYNSGLKVN